MQASPLSRSLYPQVIRVLQHNFGRQPAIEPDPSYGFLHNRIIQGQTGNIGIVRNQGIIQAVFASGGFLFVAGHREAARAIYDKVRFTSWVHMSGDEALATDIDTMFRTRLLCKKKGRERIHNVMCVTPETFTPTAMPPGYTVRLATIHDAIPITMMTAQARLDEGVGPPMRLMEAQTFQRILMAAIITQTVWVVENSVGKPIGTARTSHSHEDLGMNITNVFVHEECRGLGVGKALLSNMIETKFAEGIPNATLEVHEHNEPAMRAYRGLGFSLIKRFLVVLTT